MTENLNIINKKGSTAKKHITCRHCKFARPDPSANERKWTAYECGNPDSEYYRCLLNVTRRGEKQSQITWTGCCLGEREVVCEQNNQKSK